MLRLRQRGSSRANGGWLWRGGYARQHTWNTSQPTITLNRRKVKGALRGDGLPRSRSSLRTSHREVSGFGDRVSVRKAPRKPLRVANSALPDGNDPSHPASSETWYLRPEPSLVPIRPLALIGQCR